MDEIAEHAELSKGTIYLYYRSKEDLYTAVALRGAAILIKMFEDAISTGEPTLKLLGNIGDAYIRYFKNHRDYYRMSYVHANEDFHSQISPHIRESCALADRSIWGAVVGTVQKGMDEGLIRTDLTSTEAGVMLWANNDGLMRLIDRNDQQLTEELHIDLEQVLRKSSIILLEGMLTDRGKIELAGLISGTR
jgi:AcrR family transcriptional regulator